MLNDKLKPYAYTWPYEDFSPSKGWTFNQENHDYLLTMPEEVEKVAKDSRWPVFFPSSISLVTTGNDNKTALEKVVGASIVNRFPYIVALNFCREELSQRHHARASFMEKLEKNRYAAIQFLPPGNELDKIMKEINEVPEKETHRRISGAQLAVRGAVTNPASVFESAYMVYEARLVEPGKDFDGKPIYEKPWIDVGSHRIYFLEIQAIQLRQDISQGKSQILWRSLPAWSPQPNTSTSRLKAKDVPSDGSYVKKFTAHYTFPSKNTVVFEADDIKQGMAIKFLPPLPGDQVEVDNERAKWPCFFPASIGMISTWTDKSEANVMPCGSTFMASRYPLTIATCISFAVINERYSPRASLKFVQNTGTFGCSVPYINDFFIDAIQYSGNVSFAKDPQKVQHSGLEIVDSEWGPVLKDSPIFFGCQVKETINLGTHLMFVGEVKEIRVLQDVSPQNGLEWCPWPAILDE